MGLLREQTRRFWTATIFLALGPTLIGLTVFRIIHRSGVDVKYLYEREIAKSVGYEVQIERIEFLRPSSERLVNVEFMDPFTQEAFAFSPEIYLFHSHDSRLLKQFEPAFEKRQGQTNVNVSDQEAPSLREASSNAPISDYSQAFLAVVIPQLYVKEARDLAIKREKPDAVTVIKEAHRTGGYVIMAHPYLVSEPVTYKGHIVTRSVFIEHLISAGLDGIEASYTYDKTSYFGPVNKNEIKKLIIQYYGERLFISGGSDYHADGKKGVKNPRDIGDCGIEMEDFLANERLVSLLYHK